MSGCFLFKKKLEAVPSEDELVEMEREYDLTVEDLYYDYYVDFEHFSCKVEYGTFIEYDEDEPHTIVLSVIYETECKCDSEKLDDSWKDWYDCDEPNELEDDILSDVEKEFSDWELFHVEHYK